APYLMRPYRFLSDPRGVGKGKPHMVLAMHARGTDAETITRRTGCPKAAVRRYIEEYEAGKKESDLAVYLGKDVGTKEFCRLSGPWQRVYGAGSPAAPSRGCAAGARSVCALSALAGSSTVGAEIAPRPTSTTPTPAAAVPKARAASTGGTPQR